jgi:hydroxymethylpyrimidine/phosphomethylpyrimidine kinase
MRSSTARVLIVAGSDSGGGAGLQADLKTVTALGGYAATAVTALTAQNTLGVAGVLPVPAAFVRQQMEVVLSDLGADAVKTGMLHDAEVVGVVADALAEAVGKRPGMPVVVDPVLVAKGGARLLRADAERAVLERLVPLAAVVTPNAPELAALTGLEVGTVEELEAAGRALLARGARAVLAKGGHVPGEVVTDLLLEATGGGVMVTRFEGPRIHSRSTHGTGCTLASAVATGLAEGRSLAEAVERARRYVRGAIERAPGFGAGHGPLAHGWTVGPLP